MHKRKLMAKANKVDKTDSPTDRQPTTERRPSRRGRKFVGGHVEPELAKEIKLLAAQRDTTVQALVEESLRDVLKKYASGASAE